MWDAERRLDTLDLLRRIQLLERAVILLLGSDRYDWDPKEGVTLTRLSANDEAAQMIVNLRAWNPKSLDKGG
jgi:hypothetical protein